MEGSKRWIVTYTKHIRQKRKVYQDGVLELHCPSNKVLLYDDSGKLLDSRFLKKDDWVECGVTLAFETHLVDIGDCDETYMPPKDFKVSGNDGKSNEKAEIYVQNSRNPFLVKKKRQLDKHGSTNVYPYDTLVTKRGNKRIELQTSSKVQTQPNSKPAIMRGLEPKNIPPDKEVISRKSVVSRLTKGEEVLMNKPPRRDALQILSTLRRPPQESPMTRNPLEDQACPQSLDLFHSDRQGRGGALKSVISPETLSDVTKLVNPDRKAELPAVRCSASSSLLYSREELCETSATNPGVESTVKDSLDLGTSSIVSEASDAGIHANGSSGRICIEESLGSYAEEKPKLGCAALDNNRMQIEEQGNNKICCQLHTDDMNSEREGFEELHSSSAPILCYVTASPRFDDKDKDLDLKTSSGKTTRADELPSFDLGIEL